MDSLSFTKSDIKFFFVLSSIVPVLSFIIGFYTAPDSLSPKEISVVQSEEIKATLPLKRVEPAVEVEPVIEDVAPVVAEVVEKRAEPLVSERYIVQAGLFSSVKNAKKMSKSLKANALDAQILTESRGDREIYRVILGSFSTEDEAKACMEEIISAHAIKLYVADTHSIKFTQLVASL